MRDAVSPWTLDYGYKEPTADARTSENIRTPSWAERAPAWPPTGPPNHPRDSHAGAGGPVGRAAGP